MEPNNLAAHADPSILSKEEDCMEPITESMTVHPVSKPSSMNSCVHGRAIDDVLTRRGKKRTGKVCCLECGAIFDDPHLSHK